LKAVLNALRPTERYGKLGCLAEDGVAASSADERDVATESAIFALRNDIGPQRVPPLMTRRIQVDGSSGKHANGRQVGLTAVQRWLHGSSWGETIGDKTPGEKFGQQQESRL
jgi:hypothetical protein